MAKFSDLNADFQNAILEQALPKLDSIIKQLDEIQDLIFSPGYSSPFPDMSDPKGAEYLEEAQEAAEKLLEHLKKQKKYQEQILIKANQIWHKEKAAPKGWDLIEA
jgi:hypothetical protein